MKSGCVQRDPQPRDIREMGNGHDRGRQQKDIAKREKKQRPDETKRDQDKLNAGRFRFGRKERRPALEKIRERACKRNQAANKPGLAHSASGRRIFASHSARFAIQRRKMRPRTKPTPSAVKIALVGFSRTYCSASS